MPRNSKEEARTIRAKIAALLNEGKSYREINSLTGAGHGTISRVKRILDDPNEDLEADRREQNGRPDAYDPAIKEKILEARKLTGYGPRLLWAVIQRDPERYGISLDCLPSPATISAWLKDAGMAKRAIGPGDTRYYPIDYVDDAGFLTIDGWGPWHIKAERLYLITINDRFTRLGLAVPATKRVTTGEWIHAIQTARYHLLGGEAPHTLFTDNGIGMVITNGHTPQAVRYTLQAGTRIVYIPPGQPWRNGRLENWHWRIEREYFREKQPHSVKEAIAGLLGYINYYNIDRPHGSLHWKAPADNAPWYEPVTAEDVAVPNYPTLPPQKGIVDAIRMCENDGTCELWTNDYLRVSSVFAGQYLRIRMYCDPDKETQLGEVIWQGGKNKEPLIVCTFNHQMDRERQRGQPLVTNLRLVDFDNPITPPPTSLQIRGWTKPSITIRLSALPNASAVSTGARLKDSNGDYTPDGIALAAKLAEHFAAIRQHILDFQPAIDEKEHVHEHMLFEVEMLLDQVWERLQGYL